MKTWIHIHIEQVRRALWLVVVLLSFIVAIEYVTNGSTSSSFVRLPLSTLSGAPDAYVQAYLPIGNQSLRAVTAKSFLVKDLETGEVLASKKSTTTVPIASVSKLFAAIVALEKMDLGTTTIVSSRAVRTEGAAGSLVAKERIVVGDLLYPLLMESSNDAAEVLAESYGRDAFIEEMNGVAKRLGLLSTTFSDPSGLSYKNVSTADDLVKLGNYIVHSVPRILEISKTTTYTSKKIVGGRVHTWWNGNKFVLAHDRNYIGGKNGYIPEALQTSLSMFSVPFVNDYKASTTRRDIAVVVLKSATRQNDMTALVRAVTKGLAYSKKPSKEASLLFVGDVMLDRDIERVADEAWGGDLLHVFDNSFFVPTATVAFANLEGPVSDKGYDLRNLYSFRMKPEAATTMRQAGFRVVSVANNHAGDWARAAFSDTLERLKNAGIEAAGGGMTYADARTARIVDANGLKIGYLAFTDVGPQWLTENKSLPVVLSASDPLFDEIVRDASAQVDYLVVSFHFGDEYATSANDRQKSLARRAVDDGAAIVVGHHPHVIQEVERYKNGVIAYSLGNYVFDQPFSDGTMEGKVLEIVVDEKSIQEVNEGLTRQNKLYQPTLVDGQDF